MKRDFGKKKEEAHWSYCVKGPLLPSALGRAYWERGERTRRLDFVPSVCSWGASVCSINTR